MDENTKEKIKIDFVSDHILANVTRMCGYILQKNDKAAPFNKLDIVNYELRNHDVAEWYIVSYTLMNELKAQGECVIDLFDGCLWGRQTSGQMIISDKVIDRICEKRGMFKIEATEF